MQQFRELSRTRTIYSTETHTTLVTGNQIPALVTGMQIQTIVTDIQILQACYRHTDLVTGMEVVGPSKRAWAGILIEFFWCMGEFLLLLLAYFIRNWRHLEIALSVPSIFLLAYWWSVLCLLHP